MLLNEFSEFEKNIIWKKREKASNNEYGESVYNFSTQNIVGIILQKRIVLDHDDMGKEEFDAVLRTEVEGLDRGDEIECEGIRYTIEKSPQKYEDVWGGGVYFKIFLKRYE